MTPRTTAAIETADRIALADRLGAAITERYRFAACRTWARGETVRVYVNDGRDRGYLDVTPGMLVDQTKGVSSPVLDAVNAIL